MFLAKKILGSLLKPLPLSLLIALIGWYLLWFSHRRKLGSIAIGISLLLAIGSSTPIIANGLIKPLEQRYPAIIDTTPYDSVEYIVVLGGGHNVDSDRPISDHLGRSSTKRLLEGIRLHQQIPSAKLVLSGGAVYGIHREADTMAAMVKALGLSLDRMIIENTTRDTAEQASAISKLLGKQPFLLVTSAVHMPRSMLLMEQYNLNPIAAPTDYRTNKTIWSSPNAYLPNGSALRKSESAIHEYLGQWWAIIKSKVRS